MTAAPAYPCPCCGYVVFRGPPGSDEICPICFWEDDASMLRWFDQGGGANVPSLIEAQRNVARFGAAEERLRAHVRPPLATDARDPSWRPIDPAVDRPDSAGQDDATTPYYWRRRRP